MSRILSYAAASAVLALGGLWVVAQIDLTSFQPGEVISSEQVNGNFEALATEVAAKQATITGSCPPGSSIRRIDAEGGVTCETDDASGSGTDYLAGAGLVLNGTEFAIAAPYRLPQACADGQLAAAEAGGWTCTDDASATGLTDVESDATLAGDGTPGDPLSIAVPARLDGSSNSTATFWATNSSSGSAVRGEHADGTVGYLGFEAYGVYGQHSAGNMGRLGSDDYGVFGTNTVFDSSGYLGGDDTGAYGQNGFASGRGVYGLASHPTGTNGGVIGRSESSAGAGVRGIAAATSGTPYGVYGRTAADDGFGVWAENTANGGFGYLGGAWGAYGANGDRSAAGVLGATDAAVVGLASPAYSGILAGRFDGDVEIDGDLVVTGTVNPPSSRRIKRDIVAVDTADVLSKVATMPIASWSYLADHDGARHLGPMAEDFHAAFGLGSSDARIATVDADGVALAAIQGLHRLVEEKEARIGELEIRLADLEARLDAMAR